MKKRIMTAGMLAMILAMGMTACANADTKEKSTTKKEQVSESDEKKEQKMSDNEANVMNEKQKKIYEKIKKTYNAEEQQKIADELEKKKESQEYTLSNMLIEYNPFGTNTQSLYVYFETDSAVKVSYTIHVKEDDIADFSRNVYQDEEYQKEHEFQVIGLIPDTENTITFYITNEDGSTDTKEIVYEMGSLYGEEAVQLDADVKQSADKLEDGLYVVLGNDSPSMDFMYYYDNNGVLRGEVPLLGYRSHRLIFDENSMYYSISEKKMAQVNRLGQVTKVYDLGNYKLHHDYVFDENGNMLILAAAIATVEGNAQYAEKHWEVLTTWADYLLEKGLDPENQLCTDDFAGHFAHNANLSIKAILGVASYGKLAGMLGKQDIAEKYISKAKDMAAQWIKMADDGDHYRLTFDKSGTWSQKYNLVWDKLLGLNIFPESVAQKEIAYYLTKQNTYGLPLDSRETYTKNDWIMWTAAMSNDTATFKKFISPIYKFMNETPDRVPMSDWTWTIEPNQRGFQARSVIGGYWMQVLKGKLIQ